MRKNIFGFAVLTALCGIIAAWGNGWSFEPLPRQGSPDENGKTNRLKQILLPPMEESGGVALQKIADASLDAILNQRLGYAVGSRLNPLQLVNYLELETPERGFYELYVRDGKSATSRGLQLTFRQYGVHHLRIGGFAGEMLAGRKAGTERPSLFDISEGIAGWNQVSLRPRFFRDYDVLRQSPHVAVGYRQADWLGNPLWELRARAQARFDFDDRHFHHPTFEGAGVLYLSRNIALESGIQLRNEWNGDLVRKGERQRVALFFGEVWESRRYGTLRAGVSGSDIAETMRAEIVYWRPR